jgi:hypothetical protein
VQLSIIIGEYLYQAENFIYYYYFIVEDDSENKIIIWHLGAKLNKVLQSLVKKLIWNICIMKRFHIIGIFHMAREKMFKIFMNIFPNQGSK